MCDESILMLLLFFCARERASQPRGGMNLMENTHFNSFDVTMALILGVSGIFAFRRGLVKEITALGTWILSSLFAFAFYPIAKPFFHKHIENAMLADAATALGLFSLAIIVLVPLGDYLGTLVKGPRLGAIDRSLGFVFGLVRGFLIVCLIFLGVTFFFPEDKPEQQPAWLASARVKPALAYGVKAFQGFVPEDAGAMLARKAQDSRDAAQEAAQDARRLEDISTPVPFNHATAEEASSYGEKARDTMNELMDGKVPE